MPLTRKILNDLGVPKEHIDSIMASREDILEGYLPRADAERNTAAAVQTALDAAKATPTDITKHPDYIKLQTTLAEKDAAAATAKRDAAMQLALTAAKVRNPKAALALLDTSKLELQTDGTVKGLKEALEGLQKTDGYLFASEAAPAAQFGFNPPPASATATGLNAQIEAARTEGNMPLVAALIRQAGTAKT